MSNSISYSRPKWDLWMVAALVCVAVVLGIYPADRTVWCVEMVWAVGLWAILLLTRSKFRFSTSDYLCFFVWTVLQLVGAHYMFELVPMSVVAVAGLWKIVEWLYAVVDGGKAGAAFLGSQGDDWDAQKDILCDTLGAICSTALFLCRERKSAQ